MSLYITSLTQSSQSTLILFTSDGTRMSQHVHAFTVMCVPTHTHTHTHQANHDGLSKTEDSKERQTDKHTNK